MPLTDDTFAGTNAPEFTVSEISFALKKMIEGEFAHVRIRGEIGRVSTPRSGHVYLDLKDERAVIAGVIWKGTVRKLRVRPEEGLEVVVTGRLTTYPGASKYQVVIESMAPAGIGALMAMLERRKAQLKAEGLFDPARKRRPPLLPKVVGVITSPSGAVIRDILHRLRDRFPIRVVIWPVAVQGEHCALEVARAIRGFNALPEGGPVPRPDALIVARGGGSIEDLWGFNEEIVVRAAAESAIPLISAVGHETDTTLIDLAADIRAPTPTAAAEMLVPVRRELLADVATLGERLVHAADRLLAERGRRLGDLARLLPRADDLLARPRHRLDRAEARLVRALEARAGRARTRHAALAGRMTLRLLERTIALKRERLAAPVQRLEVAIRRKRTDARRRSIETGRRLRPALARRQIEKGHHALETAARRLALQARSQLRQLGQRLESLDRMRQSLGWRETLARGYAVIRGPGGEGVITSKGAALPLPRLEIEFHDGRLPVLPDQGTPRKAPAPREGSHRASQGGARKPPRSSKPPEGQGSLF